jgi:hypothetical protein
MACLSESKMKITTTPHSQKVQNIKELEGEYYVLNNLEFTKIGSIYDYYEIIKGPKEFKSRDVIAILEAKLLPSFLCMAENGFDKMREIVYLKPPFDSQLNHKIIEIFKRKILRVFLEVNVYFAYESVVLEKYDIKDGISIYKNI